MLAAALSAAGVFTEIEYRYTKYALSVLFILVVALIVFGVVVPWATRRSAGGAGTGLVLSLLGVLTVVAFWSGLPPVLAVGGIVLGYVGRRADTIRRRRVAGAAIGLGALALILDGIAYGTDIASRF
jgi:prepilin signal peptidase PulO-like enzyme (type II secretory pathway)